MAGVAVADRAIEAALPDYQLGEVLGEGGFGVVRFGRHRTLDRPAAVKQIPAALATDPEVRARFVQEAQTLASFDHPHIVRLYNYVEREELCLLVLEYLPGGTLADTTAGRGITAATACGIGLVTCDGLHYAHQHDVLHRDIKPENALYTAEGALKVTDFGMAKVVGGRDVLATMAGEILGTPAYMAPEQATAAAVGPPADVYAAGVMLYELLSGRQPYSADGGSMMLLYRHSFEDATPLPDIAPDVPRPIAEVVMQALARAPEDRYPTAEAFGVALGAAAGRALGPGWLAQSDVQLRSPGPILESARAVAVGMPAPAPVAESVHVRRDPESLRQPAPARASDLHADELVPVRHVLTAPRRPGVAAAVTAGLLAGTTLCAAAGLAPATTGTALPARTITLAATAAGGPTTDISAGGPGTADLATPLRFRLSNARGSRTAGTTSAALWMDVLGVPLIREPTAAPVTRGRLRIPAQSLRYVVAGPVRAQLELRKRDGAVVRHDFVLTPATGGFLSVPGVLTGGLLLFLLAYAESALRPMWRRGRRLLPGILRMAAVGAGFGVAAVLVAWLTAGPPLDPATTAVCALLGSGAGIGAAITVADLGRRARARRVRDVGRTGAPQPAR